LCGNEVFLKILGLKGYVGNMAYFFLSCRC